MQAFIALNEKIYNNATLCKIILLNNLKPASFFKNINHINRYQQHKCNGNIKSIRIVEIRNMFEIHTKNTADNGCRS